MLKINRRIAEKSVIFTECSQNIHQKLIDIAATLCYNIKAVYSDWGLKPAIVGIHQTPLLRLSVIFT